MSALWSRRKSQAIHLLSFLAFARWLLTWTDSTLWARWGRSLASDLLWRLGRVHLTSASSSWSPASGPTRPRPGWCAAEASRWSNCCQGSFLTNFSSCLLMLFRGFVEYHWIRTRLVVSQVYHRWNKMQSFDLLICHHHQSHLKANHPEL